MAIDPERVYTDEQGRPEEWLRPGDVAQLLKVHPATVTRWAKTGKLPYITTPAGHRRYSASVVASLITGGDITPFGK